MNLRPLLHTLFGIALLTSMPSSAADLRELRREVAEYMRQANVPGLTIAASQNGHILWKAGYGWADRERHIAATPETPFFVASVTKSITATAIMQLNERRVIALDQPVNAYLGNAKVHSPRWNVSETTVRRVMSHTGGLTTFSRWCPPSSTACNIDEEIEQYGVVVWPPGRVFDYSNLGYGILGRVIERTTGETLDEYFQKAIFLPLGMRHCGITVTAGTAAQYDQTTDARSAERVSGHPGATGLHCSAADLLRFGSFELHEGVAPQSLPNTRDIRVMQHPEPATHDQYGLGWWVQERGGIEVISAQGGTTDSYAILEIVPKEHIVVVVIANSYSPFVSGLADRILTKLLPSATPSSARASVQSHAAPAPMGTWTGEIDTTNGAIPLSLRINADGSASASVGGAAPVVLTNVSAKPTHFYGELSGNDSIPDAPHLYVLDLDLAIHGDEMIGAATTTPPPGHDGDQLPHWTDLVRQGAAH